MGRYISLLLFIWLALGQEGINDLLIKYAESSINFKSGQKLIIKYANEELNVFFNNESIEGEFKSIDNDFLMISTGYAIAEKIPLSSIKKITVPSKIPTNIIFIKGSFS